MTDFWLLDVFALVGFVSCLSFAFLAFATIVYMWRDRTGRELLDLVDADEDWRAWRDFGEHVPSDADWAWAGRGHTKAQTRGSDPDGA